MSLESLYSKRGYMYFNGFWVFTATMITLATFGMVFGLSYQGLLKQARINWDTKKCSPLYMPFAGLINPVQGLSTGQATAQNFDYCVNLDFSDAFKLLLMPLEFVTFAIIQSIDLLAQMMAAIVALLNSLKFQFGDIFKDVFGSLSNVVIPILVQIIKIRDTMAKANATMVTTLYTSMIIYNTMVSGVLNTLNIVFNLLLILIAALIAMFLVGVILIPTPIFPVGFIIVGVAHIAVLVLVIPSIVIYVLLHQFITNTFNTKAPLAPGIPEMKRPKRPRLKFW